MLSKDLEMLQDLFENSLVATMIFREDGIILKVNRQFELLTGESKGAVEGKKSWTQYLAASQQSSITSYLAQSPAEGVTPQLSMEADIATNKGTCTVLMHLSSLKRPGLFSISMMDITERKANERDLEKAKKEAESSEQLKGAFLSNLSHEIRTPINSIVGFADLLKMPNLTEEKRALYLDYVINGSNDLLMLIEKITTIARLDSGQFKISNREFDLHAKMRDIESKYREELVRRKKEAIQLTFLSPGRDEEFLITADPMRISEVVTNLLENSMKFTDSGKIEFGYTLRKADTTPEGEDTLLFFVKDTGSGIAASNEKTIFDRFVKFIEKEETIYKGAGLGLAICKGIVELVGGKIWVESRKDEGAHFYFTYPLSQGPKQRATGITKEQQAGDKLIDWSNKEALVAEDVESNYMFIKELIAPSQIRVLRARNGKEAVELFHKHPSIDIVIMDILMPEMDGYEASRLIRETNPGIPIIAQSAFSFEGDIKDGLYAGSFNDYITKPYTRKVLLAIMKKYLSND